MSTMLGDNPFLNAILANPADDFPRLVYADWLDERGDPRGEFIRVQVELARQPRDWIDAAVKGVAPDWMKYEFEWVEWIDGLRARERSLLAIHGEDWALFGLIRPAGIEVGGPRRRLEPCRLVNKATVGSEFRDTRGIIMEWRYSRGFVSAITCTADDWMRHADAIMAATPLERVTLTTPVPVFADDLMGPIRYMGPAELNQHWPAIKFDLLSR